MARLFKPKYAIMQAVLDDDGNPVKVECIAKRGKNKGKVVLVPKREPKRGRGGAPVYRKTDCWYVEHVDAAGRQKRVKGYRDKVATNQLAAKLEKKVAREREGVVDRSTEQAARSLSEHVADFVSAMAANDDISDWYASEAERRLRAVIDGCGFRTVGDVTPSAVERFLASLTYRVGDEEIRTGPATRNTYHQSVKRFCQWLLDDGRIPAHPLVTLKPARVKSERRRRRALTEAEIADLLDAARRRPLLDAMTVRHGPRKGQAVARLRPAMRIQLERIGRERSLIYLTLILTGLRRGELAQICWADLDLSGSQAWLTVSAEIAKGDEAATLPIRADLAVDLLVWRSECGNPAGAALVFSVPKRLVAILNRDLRLAGIPKQDADGRTIDVHAFRKTTGSALAAAGVAQRTTQALMRHKDYRTTVKHYTDPQVRDMAAAVASSLPAASLAELSDIVGLLVAEESG